MNISLLDFSGYKRKELVQAIKIEYQLLTRSFVYRSSKQQGLRLYRALEIADQMVSDVGYNYEYRLSGGTCSCPDRTHREVECKHELAFGLVRSAMDRVGMWNFVRKENEQINDLVVAQNEYAADMHYAALEAAIDGY